MNDEIEPATDQEIELMEHTARLPITLRLIARIKAERKERDEWHAAYLQACEDYSDIVARATPASVLAEMS